MDMASSLKWIFLGAFFLAVGSAEKSRLEIEKEIMKDIYELSKFHMFIRPPRTNDSANDEPVEVNVSLYVLNVDVCTWRQEVTVQMYFRQEWNDSRLAYDSQGKVECLSTHDVTGFWTPDVFFVNEKSGHFYTLTKPNSFIKIYPNGRILYSQRVSITMSCPMKLAKFPFDVQDCPLQIESYGYTMKDIVLKWKPGFDKKAISGGDTEAKGYDVSYSQSNHFIVIGENQYSRVQLDIQLTRKTNQYIYHVYVPLFLLVVISWASFWLSPALLLPRLVLTTTTTVCTLLQTYANNNIFISFGPINALDIYVAVCCFCVFGALLENVYVSSVPKNDLDISQTESGLLNGVTLGDGKKNETETQRTVLKLLLTKLSSRIPTIDVTSRIIFPLLFILFNIIYFSRLLPNSSASYA